MMATNDQGAVHAVSWFIETGHMDRYLKEFAAHLAKHQPARQFVELPSGTHIDLNAVVWWEYLSNGDLYIYVGGTEALAFNGDVAAEIADILRQRLEVE